MTWSLFRWVWRLEAPLHVGIPPAGSLDRCRLYLPARNLWAALTAALARQEMGDTPKTIINTRKSAKSYRGLTALAIFILLSDVMESGGRGCHSLQRGTSTGEKKPNLILHYIVPFEADCSILVQVLPSIHVLILLLKSRCTRLRSSIHGGGDLRGARPGLWP